MKRIHIILILAFLVIAAMLRWKNTRIQNIEADLRRELASVDLPATTRGTLPSAEAGMSQSTRTSSRPQGQVAGLTRARAEMLEGLVISLDPNEPEEILDSFSRMEAAIANGELAEAIRYFTLLPSAYQQPLLVEKIVMAANTPDLQRSVLEQAGKSADQAAFTLLVESLAGKSSFEGNLDLMSRTELTPGKHDLAAAVIAGAKIDDDTPARAAWLLKSLQTDQTDPITHLAKSWTEGDFKAASIWLNSLPPGRSRDAAVAGFAPVTARLDGASAVDWALTISDPAQRKSTLDSVSQTWKTLEPAAATAYLQDKGIEAERTR